MTKDQNATHLFFSQKKDAKANLQNEWENCTSLFGIIFELFSVVAVFAQSPNGHLESTSKGEQQGRQTRRHNGEGYPSTDFIGVVGARDQAVE